MPGEWLEIASGLEAIFWAGAVISAPGGLISHAAYRPLSAAVGGHDAILALLGLGGGLVQISAAVLNHAPLRCLVALVMAVLWTLITNGVWVGAPGTPTGAAWSGFVAIDVLAAILLLVSGYVFLRDGEPL